MAKKRNKAVMPDEESIKGGKTAKKSRDRAEKGSKLSKGIANPVRNLIVTTVISILLGVAFFLKPYEVSQYCSYGVGGLLAIVGIIYIVIYFLRKPVSGVYRSEFVVGLVALLAGAYVALSGVLLSNGGVGYIMIIRVIGFLIIADGLLKVQYAVDIGRMKFRAWWVALIIAVLGIAIGVLTAFDFSGKSLASAQTPLSMLYSLGGSMGLGSGYGNYAAFYGGLKMLGIAFIANGILDLVSLIILAIRNRKAARIEAIYAASAMMAETKKEEIALPPEDGEPAEEIVFAPSPEPAPVFAPSAEPAPASLSVPSEKPPAQPGPAVQAEE